MLKPLAGSGAGDPRLIIGLDRPDDAGVFRLEGGPALVQTVDVITPVVDDPEDFGFIAAVNALSDIYAMGGRPLTALTFLAFPSCDLPTETAAVMLRGAGTALEREQCVLVGGHTIDDPEIKLGLAVTGTVDPGRILTKGGARPGDMIYLGKPLGTGILSTALKGEMLDDDRLAAAVAWMKRSNGPASELLTGHGVAAATDVTGFGLLGHLWEMCRASGMGAALDAGAVPLMDGVRELAADGLVPAGAYGNRDFFSRDVEAGGASEEHLLPLYDPQTSGGLLAAVPPEAADALELAGGRLETPFVRIGMFTGDHRGIRLEWS